MSKILLTRGGRVFTLRCRHAEKHVCLHQSKSGTVWGHERPARSIQVAPRDAEALKYRATVTNLAAYRRKMLEQLRRVRFVPSHQAARS